MTRALLLVCLLAGSASAQSLTLSPAVVPLAGHPGQSTTQHLTLFNGTDRELAFELLAEDVIVKTGARVFARAGDTSGGIAASAVFSTRTVNLKPKEQRVVDVTLTLPAHPSQRAVAIVFHGTTLLRGHALVSIASLLTFDLAGRASIDAGELQTLPSSASANAAVELAVTNDGEEPAIVRGVAAILDESGKLVGKIALEPHRLLPGEVATLHADYPGELRAGHYRVVATMANAAHAWTRTAELAIP